jgi:hypothetical protein
MNRPAALGAVWVLASLLGTLTLACASRSGGGAERDSGGGSPDTLLSFHDARTPNSCDSCAGECGSERCGEGTECAPDTRCRKTCRSSVDCAEIERCCGGFCYGESCVGTLAGSGLRSDAPVALAQARVNGTWAMAVDASGNLLYSEWPGSGLRVVNVGATPIGEVPPGHVGPILGDRFGCREGTAASAEIGSLTAIATDSRGDVYIADRHCKVVWRVTSDYGQLSLLAGMPGQAGDADGSGRAARFKSPRGLTMGQDGYLYLSDYQASVIRRIALDGAVTTLAGAPGDKGVVDGAANAARFVTPAGIVMSSAGELYVGDWDSSSLRLITQLDAEVPQVSSIVGAVAGAVTCGATAWSRPEGSAAPSGPVGYATLAAWGTGAIAPFWDNGVWQVTAPAGEGQPWSFAQLLDVRGVMQVAVRGQRLWTGGWLNGGAEHHTIKQWDLSNLARGHIRNVGIPGQRVGQDGNASTAVFHFSGWGGDVATDAAGNVWVADTAADRVRRISPDGVVESFGSGNRSVSVAAGGPADEARFCSPVALTVVGTDVFVVNAQCGANVMRIDSTNGNVEVRSSICPASEPNCPIPGPGAGLVADAAGNLYTTTTIAYGAGRLEKYGNSCFDGMPLVVKIPGLGTGEAVVFAGTPNNPADPQNRRKCVDGPPGTGQLGGAEGGPAGLAIDESGTLYVADTTCGVRTVDSGGTLSSVTDAVNVRGIALKTSGGAPLLYVAAADHRIKLVDIDSGAVSDLAGAEPNYDKHYADGLTGQALFWRPRALALDPNGNIIVLDQFNNRIRVVYP